jgi:sporulation protein YlmC with PRC-barrel domain
MDLPLRATLVCADGDGGDVAGVLFEEAARKVTHIIVRPKEAGMVRRLLPLDAVTESAPAVVRTRLTIHEVATLPAVDDIEILPTIEPVDVGMVGMPMADMPVAIPKLPAGTIALERVDDVNASDGRVGSLDAVLIDPVSLAITHIVLREGHLWAKRDVTVPIANVTKIEEDAVTLDLTKDAVGKLPSVKA